MNNVYICDSENKNKTFNSILMNMLNNNGLEFTNIQVNKRNINYNNVLIYIISSNTKDEDITNSIYNYISKNKIIWFKKVFFLTDIINDTRFTKLNKFINSNFGNKGRLYNSISFDTRFANIAICDIIKYISR
ncbi:MAG: hypothetical protein WC346_03910 [Methanogenium sp.]|jgi:hypothetical protein